MNQFSVGFSGLVRNVCSLKFLLVVPFALFLVSCGGESNELSRKKLDVILQDDLKAILEGIPDSAILEKPYYELIFYKTYDEGIYSIKAIADFYFLKNVPAKIVRKYRYHVRTRMWDRYYNEYSFFNDSTKLEKGAQ